MLELLFTKGTSLLIGIVGAFLIIAVIGYVTDVILVFIPAIKGRFREFIFTAMGFFAGLSIVFLLVLYGK